ncbi:hypothetical protein Rta_12770 [Ramlibacter tataouinensis TTB310]|uniref:Uncharacterized protein n=1 Tax=Ramlibacter tataouinensis (strain ATCC BAA-407 / DSM 14655 / LMG 21543 / TTB310) TaxID=365046 RepID=F5Y2K2_RAMTT|nr:hypothetical protein Rta_12770 [Ramlibacter tataouinensis TTB310]
MYPTTEPMTLPGALEPVPNAPPSAAAGLPEVLQLARAGNRVCPLPAPWARLYQLLLAAAARAGTQPPLPPVGAAEWRSTAALAKRMFLRDHLEWAAAHGALPAVQAFLAALPEAQWQRMGD